MKCLKLLVFIFALSKLSRRYYFANNYIVYRNCTFGRIKLSFINFTITSLRNLFDHLIFIPRKKIKSRFFFHLQKIYTCHWLAPRFLGHHICSAINNISINININIIIKRTFYVIFDESNFAYTLTLFNSSFSFIFFNILLHQCVISVILTCILSFFVCIMFFLFFVCLLQIYSGSNF